ncbi:MAG: SIMPL domain-containing protein [Anaerolineales bacterium]|nr:SIMPL domain-containing protein [Anaerolineales bacterium]
MINRITLAIVAILLVAAMAILGYIAMTPRFAPTPVSAGIVTSSVQQAATDTSGIFVAGTGKVRLKPNIATASIGVDVTAGNLAEATNQANTKMNAIIEKLKGLGVAEKDIQTTSYSIHPVTQQARAGTTPTITGYRVNNQLGITIRKIDDTGKVLDAVVAAGANNIYGISFGVDDPTPYQQQARAAAIKVAQDKAAQLAKAANVTLGKVISISEGSAMPQPVFRAAPAMMSADSVSVPVETGELEINVSVEMRFGVQ